MKVRYFVKSRDSHHEWKSAPVECDTLEDGVSRLRSYLIPEGYVGFNVEDGGYQMIPESNIGSIKVFPIKEGNP